MLLVAVATEGVHGIGLEGHLGRGLEPLVGTVGHAWPMAIRAGNAVLGVAQRKGLGEKGLMAHAAAGIALDGGALCRTGFLGGGARGG